MFRKIYFGLLMTLVVGWVAQNCPAQDNTVYATGRVRASLLTICPCANSWVFYDNSLGEDLFLAGENLASFEGAQVELVGELVDCGDCRKIEVRLLKFLPPSHPFGDLDGDHNTNLADIVVAVDYFFRAGPAPPNGWRSADLDASGGTNLVDAVLLIQMIIGRGHSLAGTVVGSFPCTDTAGTYPGCRYELAKNKIPLDTGTVDLAGRFSILLPANTYQLTLLPPQSFLTPQLNVDLTQGDYLLPALSLSREYNDSLVQVLVTEQTTFARMTEIIGYLRGDILDGPIGPGSVEYFLTLPTGEHISHAIEILPLFPEILSADPVRINCGP